MAVEIPDNVVRRYERMIESSGELDFEWLEATLDRYPNLAKRRLADDRLPLRVLFDADALPGYFQLLEQRGAEHDIFTAAASVEPVVVERLLAEDPALVHEVDAEGNTALHRACIAGLARIPNDRSRLVNVLIAAGADAEARNCYEETPLDCTLLHGGGNAIEALLDNEVDLSCRFAVAHEDYDLLANFLDETPELISWRSPRNGTTLLHIAVYQECGAEMIEYLIDRGADTVLEAESRPSGLTPLLMAFNERAYDEAEALLRAGADVNATEVRKSRRRDGTSSLDHAVDNDRVRLAELLLDRGTRLEPVRRCARSLLSRVKSEEMTDLLIARGLDPKLPNEDGTRPLDIAVEEGRRGVVDSMLRHGVEATFFVRVVLGDLGKTEELLDEQPSLIVATNDYGRPTDTASETSDRGIEIPWGSYGGTALHYAAKGGSHEMVRFLLEGGADVNAATRAGWTPFHDAVYYSIYNDLREGEAIIRTLVGAGADLDAQTIGGYRPLEIAEFLGRLAGFAEKAADTFDLLQDLDSQ